MDGPNFKIEKKTIFEGWAVWPLAQAYFIEKGNNIWVLFSVGIGLKNDDGSPFADWDHSIFDKKEESETYKSSSCGRATMSTSGNGSHHAVYPLRCKVKVRGLPSEKSNYQQSLHCLCKRIDSFDDLEGQNHMKSSGQWEPRGASKVR